MKTCTALSAESTLRISVISLADSRAGFFPSSHPASQVQMCAPSAKKEKSLIAHLNLKKELTAEVL